MEINKKLTIYEMNENKILKSANKQIRLEFTLINIISNNIE